MNLKIVKANKLHLSTPLLTQTSPSWNGVAKSVPPLLPRGEKDLLVTATETVTGYEP